MLCLVWPDVSIMTAAARSLEIRNSGRPSSGFAGMGATAGESGFLTYLVTVS
jgi:hypothetical protein